MITYFWISHSGELFVRNGHSEVPNFLYTAFDVSTTPPTLIRRDYALDDLRQHGAAIPEFYFDELGNLRGKDDKLVMAGPLSPEASPV